MTAVSVSLINIFTALVREFGRPLMGDFPDEQVNNYSAKAVYLRVCHYLQKCSLKPL